MGAMLFGQHEARGVHVGAGDMRMDVDAAGHRDKAARVDRLVGSGAAVRRRDDLIVANPEIADFVALVGGIDDMCAFDADQHARPLASSRQAAMRARTCATLGAALRAEAVDGDQGPGIRGVHDRVVIDARAPDHDTHVRLLGE